MIVGTDGTRLSNPRAIPSFVGRLVAAFRGSVMPGAVGPLFGRDQVGTRVADPSRVWPVRRSHFGAPSSQARPVVTGLPEYARFQSRFSGEIFVADPAIYQRIVRRRMAAPPIVGALTPSRTQDYRAPMYVGVPPGAGPATAPPTPARRIIGRGPSYGP